MIRRISLILAISIFLSACGGSPAATEPPITESPAVEAILPTEAPPTEPLPTEMPTIEPTATMDPSSLPVTSGPKEYPQNVSPLTGKIAADNALLERRPVAVKVQLFPRSGRPPMGISQADIVYDYYQTFGLTRLHAIFLSQDAENVGPVRSARLLDQSLVSMYQSIFAFGSAEQRTYSKLFNSDFANRLVVEGYANCPPLCRTDPNGRNELVANTKEMSSAYGTQNSDNIRQDLSGMYFDSAPPSGGKSDKQISIRFSISSYNLWDYNPDTGRYLRYQDTVEAADQSLEAVEALIDRQSNEQIAADNVVVLLVPHQYAFGTKPGVNEVIDIGLSGSGPAYAFRDGQVFEVVWNRPAKNSVLFLTYPDGSFYPFKPGNTWFEVVGSSTKVENPSADSYRFAHQIP